MVPVISLRPAFIFVFIWWNREQSDKEIYQVFGGENKNPSKWLDSEGWNFVPVWV